MKFPHPCTRCGFCCIVETCPIGVAVYNTAKRARCPGLVWYGDRAGCRIMIQFPELAKAMGAGAGCCILARLIVDGRTVDFAALPPELKTKIAQMRMTLNE